MTLDTLLRRHCIRILPGHAYVGLSRATSLDGLIIHNISQTTIRANPKVMPLSRPSIQLAAAVCMP
jgi:hypothetical protein